MNKKVSEFKAGDKVKCVSNKNLSKLTAGKEYIALEVECIVLETEFKYVKIINDDNEEALYLAERFEKVEGNKMKTFKQVIADIKEGEVWRNTNSDSRISRIEFNQDFKTIVFYGNEEGVSGNSLCATNLTDKFTLQRKKYTFTEAFKAYEEGKEIESCESEYKHAKMDNDDRVFESEQ